MTFVFYGFPSQRSTSPWTLRSTVPHTGRPTAMSCPTAQHLSDLRQRHELVPSFEEALVLHLSEPCVACWRCLDSLPALAAPDAEPGWGDGPTLRWSTSPVVLALRTLAGWPPRRWLRPARRDALDRVRWPLGFLRLVLEEARAWAHRDLEGSIELGRWVEISGQLRARQGSRSDIDGLCAHAMLHLADTLTPRQPGTAADLILHATDLMAEGDAARGLAELSHDALFDARQLAAQAALAEKHGPDFAHQEHLLAAARLVEHRHAPHRVELILRHVGFLIGAGRLDDARTTLAEARRRLRGLDQPLLVHSLHHHATALALAEAGLAPAGVPRVARLAEAIGQLASCHPLPLVFDPAVAHHHAFLSRRLEEEREVLHPERLRQALEEVTDPEHQLYLRLTLAASPGARPGEGPEAVVDRPPGLCHRLARRHQELAVVRRRFGSVLAVRQLVDPILAVFERRMTSPA